MRAGHVLRTSVIAILLAVTGFVIGRVTVPAGQATAVGDLHSQDGEPAARNSQKWYCSMHPQIIRDRPGLCPLCEMDLIPMPEDLAVGGAPRELVVSEAAAKLMDVQTSPVERKLVTNEIRMVGKVQYDETRVKNITAWVPGRLDRLYVDFTGTSVRRGDHLVSIYSPELIGAQAELLQAAKAADNLGQVASGYLSRSAVNTLEAAREKLRLLGLTPEQIQEIEQSGKPLTQLTIYAPIGGVVIQKMASEGMYVGTGTHIYTVADLSHLWVKLDAYESDLSWIRYGQPVQFTTEAYPGRQFQGWISFIDPVLDARTRTVKVRVDVPNPGGELKPEMFVRAVVKSQMTLQGKVMDPDMAGKWICPMHPSIVQAELGECDLCGMDLVTTESLGYVAAAVPPQLPLVIPQSAPLVTGKRAVVYVRKPGVEVPTFEGREVVLGPKAGAYYLVESGLSEGEQVVTHGNFKIDSALQIQARPSMMNPQGGAMPGGHQHGVQSSARQAAGGTPVAETPDTIQELCPVMGGRIDPTVYVEYKGKTVYFCCKGCPEEFLAHPEKYLDKLPQFQGQASEPDAEPAGGPGNR